MKEEIFYDGIIFRSGKQDKLFTEFKWKEWKFPSDWHFKFNRYFLGCSEYRNGCKWAKTIWVHDA